VVRIYDVFFDYRVLLDTDAFFREVIVGPEFQRAMSTAEFHYLCGKYVRAREEALGLERRSLLAAASDAECRSTPRRRRLLDRHERRGQGARGQQAPLRRQRRRQRDRAIVWDAKSRAARARVDPGRREPQELRAPDRAADPGGAGIEEKGHDYFFAITTRARQRRALGRDPAEAVSWGKIDPDQLPAP
jgi:deoxyhypusine synthase